MKEGAVEFREALLSMDRVKASDILDEAAIPGDMSVVESIILDALEDIGAAWEKGDLSLSQVYMAGVISEELVTPFLSHEKLDPGEKPSTAIAVLEDHHALGKRIVLSLMRAEGLAVMDYGQGVTAEVIAERASNDGIETLCISTLMLHSALRIKTLREELAKRNSYPKIIVGGAPFRLDPELWKDVGADGFCANAFQIFQILERMGGTRS